MIRERGIVLEICPTSNLNTRVVSGWDEFRWIFDTFRRNEVRFTINTDGPEMLKTYIRDEMAPLGRLGILSVDGPGARGGDLAGGLVRAERLGRAGAASASPPPRGPSSAKRPRPQCGRARRCGRCSSGRRPRCASRAGRPCRGARGRARARPGRRRRARRDAADRAVALDEADDAVGADHRFGEVALLVLDHRELTGAVDERGVGRHARRRCAGGTDPESGAGAPRTRHR